MNSVWLCGMIGVVRRSSPIEEEGRGLEGFSWLSDGVR